MSGLGGPLVTGPLDYGDPKGTGGIHRQTGLTTVQLALMTEPFITKVLVLFIVRIPVVHGSIHPDIFCWPLLQAGPIWIQDRVPISIPAAQTNYTPLPTQPSAYPRPTTYFPLPRSLSWLYSRICKAPQILLYPYAFPNHTLFLILLNRLPPNVQYTTPLNPSALAGWNSS